MISPPEEAKKPHTRTHKEQLPIKYQYVSHLTTKYRAGITGMPYVDKGMHLTGDNQKNKKGVPHTTQKFITYDGTEITPKSSDGSHMIFKTDINGEKYMQEVWFKHIEPKAHDIHRATQVIPILNREDPGCKCCYCCNPCPCIDSWNRCGEGEGLTFGGKQLSDNPLTHHYMHVGHNCSYNIRSNDLFWAVLDIFESFGEEIVLEDDEKEAAEAAKANLHTVNKTMQYNDIILYFILGDHDNQQKRRTHDEHDHIEMMVEIDKSISEIAAQTKIDKKDTTPISAKDLQDAYKKKWKSNIFAYFEMTGGFYKGFAQAGKTMTHDNKPLHFHWEKVCAVVEFCGGEVSFEQFLQILGLQQRSECGKILCCCCEQECCGGETFCNNVTCQICGDSTKWSKPGYCKESGGPCGPCYESCGCQSCCNV
jgi:hypothetical protein